jgi:hypothetical protein
MRIRTRTGLSFHFPRFFLNDRGFPGSAPGVLGCDGVCNCPAAPERLKADGFISAFACLRLKQMTAHTGPVAWSCRVGIKVHHGAARVAHRDGDGGGVVFLAELEHTAHPLVLLEGSRSQ